MFKLDSQAKPNGTYLHAFLSKELKPTLSFSFEQILNYPGIANICNFDIGL